MRKMLVKELQPFEDATNVTEQTPVIEMVKLLTEHPLAHNLCVLDRQGNFIGLINRKRLFKAVFSDFIAADSRVSHLLKMSTSESASDLLVKQVITIKEGDSLDDVIKKMIKNDLCEVPVLSEQGMVLGILTYKKILSEWLLQESAGE